MFSPDGSIEFLLNLFHLFTARIGLLSNLKCEEFLWQKGLDLKDLREFLKIILPMLANCMVHGVV